MNAKRFFAVVLVAAAVVLGVAAAFVAWTDPLMRGGLADGETALFINQRYEEPGLIRSQDYSAVVMGTSLVANYRASWFTEGLGEKTLKITFPDGWISEFDTALDLAFSTHPDLDKVFFGLDPNILVRSDSERTVELPKYLYNNNPLDDVEFYLNADSVVLAAKTLAARANGTGTDLDSAYLLQAEFSKKNAIFGYPRPEVSDTVLPEDAFRAACDENLAVVKSWLEEHPDTEFTIWFPPYSILYWDKMTREGRADAIIWAVEYATEQLLQYDNVKVHCFLIDYNTILTLAQYADHVHASTVVTERMTPYLLEGKFRFTEENYQLRLDELREFVANYDYDKVFESLW